MNCNQKDLFLEGEADAWLMRNRTVLEQYNPDQDIVSKLLLKCLQPKSMIAEVGCSLANRIAHLVSLNGGTGFELDPSQATVLEAQRLHSGLHVVCGTADKLPWGDGSMDCIILRKESTYSYPEAPRFHEAA